MARKKSITKRRQALFLGKLKATGNVSAAAIAGEIGRGSWYEKRKRDEAFAEAWDDCELEYLNGLEQVAIKRAVVGETEDTPYTSYENGERVAILKARHPAYKERKAVELTSPDGSMTPDREAKVADYANLTDEELRQLVELERKARGGAAA